MGIQIKCPICRNFGTQRVFNAIVRDKYQAEFRFCDQCQFLFIEAPKWLDDAYKDPINVYDTGIIARNLTLSRTTSVILYFLFDREGRLPALCGPDEPQHNCTYRFRGRAGRSARSRQASPCDARYDGAAGSRRGGDGQAHRNRWTEHHRERVWDSRKPDDLQLYLVSVAAQAVLRKGPIAERCAS